MAWTLDTNGIRRLQRALNYAIWYTEDRHIPITGVIDANTRRSVREFQRVFDLPQDGNISAQIQDMLAAEMNRKNIADY